MSQQAPAANGKPAEQIKSDSKNGATVKTEVATIPKKEEAKEVKGELPPIDDRILRVQQLADLVEKHDALLESQKKLNSFRFSSDGQRDTIVIEDSRGNEFTTSNSAVIAAVVDVMKKTLADKIAEVESQIRF